MKGIGRNLAAAAAALAVAGATAAVASAQNAEAPAVEIPAAVMEQGQSVYEANCLACHGAEGQGGGGPVLAGEETLADTTMVVRQILFGGGFMPAFGPDLTDGRIAAVATYIRNSFGNSFGIVDRSEVMANR